MIKRLLSASHQIQEKAGRYTDANQVCFCFGVGCGGSMKSVHLPLCLK